MRMYWKQKSEIFKKNNNIRTLLILMLGTNVKTTLNTEEKHTLITYNFFGVLLSNSTHFYKINTFHSLTSKLILEHIKLNLNRQRKDIKSLHVI